MAKVTNKWPQGSDVKDETEGFIVTAQDQSLLENAYKAQIVKDGSDWVCCVCCKYDETINHIVSGCPVLAKNDNIRHDRVGKNLPWKICTNYDIAVPVEWYKHEPKDETNRNNATILGELPYSSRQKD